MKPRLLISLLVILLSAFGQGCVVWRYTITPPVTGKVIDASTQLPIQGAKVGFRKHEKKETLTGADGSFTSRPDSVWRPCFILPGELWPSGGTFYIERQGYNTHEQQIINSMGRPFTIVQPVKLINQTNMIEAK